MKLKTSFAVLILALSGCNEAIKPPNNEVGNAMESGAAPVVAKAKEVHVPNNALVNVPQAATSLSNVGQAQTPDELMQHTIDAERKCLAEQTSLACDSAEALIRRDVTSIKAMCGTNVSEECAGHISYFEGMPQMIRQFKERCVELKFDQRVPPNLHENYIAEAKRGCRAMSQGIRK